MQVKLKYVIVICVMLIVSGLRAQDLHFSQYFNAPLLINPANTGFNPDFDYRMGVNYRDQWSSISNYPYKTMSAWGDVQLFNNKFENGWMGVGGALLKDQAGTGNLTSTRGFASIAYHQMLGFNSLLSGGFNIGFTQQRVDLTKLTFDDQWNGKFFDANINPNEPFVYSSASYFTLQAGINYAYFASSNVYLNAGFSMSNINRPRESFFAQSNNDDRLEVRYTAFGNASIKLQDVWIANPNIYVSKMGTAYEYVLGMMLQRDLSVDNKGTLQLLAGAYYRKGDAIIPMVGFDVNNFKFTISYDATFSDLKDYNRSRGAYEISIVKSGLYSNGDRPLKCPTVKF
jgi:type IX secretion system PorP/SprF family membrane protein